MRARITTGRNLLTRDKPSLWSQQTILPLARQRSFDLHLDGERLAAAVPVSQAEQKFDRLSFIFNFFDELRRVAPYQ
jgi:hypothetical protein